MPELLVNPASEIQDSQLGQVGGIYGVRFFASTRMVDVLRIDGSGLTEREWVYGLGARFDFIVGDGQGAPLFGVEVDGSAHPDSRRMQRFALKERLCDQVEFPLVRITPRFLPKQRHGLHFLPWLAQLWLAGGAPASEQDSADPGWIPPSVRADVQRLVDAGRCRDEKLEWLTGRDEAGRHHALAWVDLLAGEVVYAEVMMKARGLPFNTDAMASGLAMRELERILPAVVEGAAPPGTAQSHRCLAAYSRGHYRVVASSE